MFNEILDFLTIIHNYIRNFDGPFNQAFHFPDPLTPPINLDRYSPSLLYHSQKGSYLFHGTQPLKYIYILVSGRCCVEKYKHGGQLYTDSTRSALSIFGLIEAYTRQYHHTVSMKCITDCVYARIPVLQFQNIINTHPELMTMCLEFVSVSYLECTQVADQLMLNPPLRSILIKLYQYCHNETFPVTITITKEELAQNLNMNLRTLYRHLDKLYASGFLTPQKGKITITELQYKRIKDELSQPAKCILP